MCVPVLSTYVDNKDKYAPTMLIRYCLLQYGQRQASSGIAGTRPWRQVGPASNNHRYTHHHGRGATARARMIVSTRFCDQCMPLPLIESVYLKMIKLSAINEGTVKKLT